MDICYREAYTMNREEARRRLVDTYLATGSLSGTARLWGTSRSVVRQWMRRSREQGEKGLRDRCRRPRDSPRRTPQEVEGRVLEAKKKTGYGRKRLAWYLARQEGLKLSPHTIRHVLRRLGFKGRRKPRKTFYPAHWAWGEALSPSPWPRWMPRTSWIRAPWAPGCGSI